jgi:hypothetical protein
MLPGHRTAKLNLDYKVLSWEYPDQFIAGVNEAKTIFDLLNTQQCLLYHHALAGFPPKETFLAAVRVGNYALWPGLTTALILKQFLDSDKTKKGTYEMAVERNAVNESYSTSNNQSRTGNSKPTSTNHQKALPHLCCGVQTFGHSPHSPNWHVPNHVIMRLLVHHGGHPSGLKLYLLQIYEEPNQRGDDHGLPKNGRQDEAHGTQVKTSLVG